MSKIGRESAVLNQNCRLVIAIGSEFHSFEAIREKSLGRVLSRCFSECTSSFPVLADLSVWKGF